ncbi:MAG: protein of unknown function with transrane region [Candidatus Nomurabacteria bacterium]|jgi:hypothetical protein|nr:protein of unknown function with transrane region [Candidatus Nomurabacteria bacterium]
MEHPTSRKHSSVMKWSLIIGIVIVMNLFFNYATSLVYKAPDYAAYFPQTQVVPDITTQQDCIAVGGQWNAQMSSPAPTKAVPAQVTGYCNPDFTKQQQFNAAQKQYDRTIFIILVIVGVLSIVTGSLVMNEVLSLAFSWGGVLSLFIASLRYWSDANNLLKVLILAVALGSLIWTAIKKFA